MKLYGYRNGRTLRALWVLEEAEVPYEYLEVDVRRGEGRQPWFLQLNPAGKVPVLVDGSQIITESAAICMHIADRHPATGLLPPAGTPERADTYKWISFVLTELDASLWTIAKHRFVLPQDRRVPNVIATATWEFSEALKILQQHIEHQSFLVGDSLTVADVLAGHTLLWAQSARIPLDSDVLQGYLAVLSRRESLVRAQGRADARSLKSRLAK